MEHDPDRARPIEIVDYDSEWPRRFEALARAIRETLTDLPCRVEHMGSTAAPGLAAKPVIDIHLTVPNSAAEDDYRPRLEILGFEFVHRDPAWFEHRLFKRWSPEANLHVFTTGCAEVDRCRLFRDWLRASPEDRAVYAEAKRALAAHAWAHVQDYADAKDTIGADIMARAQAWQAGMREPDIGAFDAPCADR